MKFKYTGKTIKTVNYGNGKYLYLIPGDMCEVSNNDIEVNAIQKLIKNHTLKVIASPPVNPISKEEIKIDSKDIVEKVKKKEKKSKSKKKKLRDFLKTKKGGK